MVQIFDESSASEIDFPTTPEGNYASRFLPPLFENGIQTYIENIEAQLLAIRVGDHLLPATVSEPQLDNCFVCSPTSFYGGFSKERVKTIQNPWLKAPLTPLVETLHRGLHFSHVDKIVYVNNWLLSTNLYPDLTASEIEEVRDALVERYPGHAIAFRSINQVENGNCYRSLRNAGFRMVACRPIYFVDAKQDEHFSSRMFKSDEKILRNTEYSIETAETLQEEDFPRIIEIYRKLYLDKYSTINPRLTTEFIRLCKENGILDLRLFRKEGRIDGVLGFTSRHGVMTSPLFGYDTSLPKELGLYRMISALLSLEAKKQGVLLNMSSGAGSYKTLRRARPYIEFNAVYTKHLGKRRNLPWTFLQTLMNRVAQPLMVSLDR